MIGLRNLAPAAIVISASVGLSADEGVKAPAEQIAKGMGALSGIWTGTEMTREQVFSGPWRRKDAEFNFSFDPAKRKGEVANIGEPVFTVTALDGKLHYAGEVRGKYMEQTRDVVEFWPLDPAGNMIVVATYEVPGPDGVMLTIRETYRLYRGTYIRRQEFRPSGSSDGFTLIRDARFQRQQ